MQRMLTLALLTCLAVVLGSAVTLGQKDEKARHVGFTVSVKPYDPFSPMNQSPPPAGEKFSVQRGEVFLLSVTGTPDKDWYSYPLTVRAPDQDAQQLGQMTLDAGEGFQPLYPISETPPRWKHEKALDLVYLRHPGPFTWSQEVYVKPSAPIGKTVNLKVNLRVQVCNTSCIWEDHTLTVPITITSEPALTPSPELTKQLEVKPTPPAVLPVPSEYQVSRKSGEDDNDSKPPSGLLASIVWALVGGFVSLLTPCVFPMIPITVSYFLKQSETNKGSALVMALIYSGTIVLVLSAGGLVLLKALVAVSTYSVTNFVIGGIFLFFAMSLLGWYDITLPSWLQDATASGEGQGGLIGVFFMALTFSIISFACVGPIYGGFISLQATAATSAVGLAHLVLPVLAYSVAFASPFFVLALIPSLMRSMPRAGSWMNSVKVVMGFLEIAAAVKFLRAGELALFGKGYLLSYDLSLGLYVAVSLACGLYLLGIYRLPHDHDAPESIGVPRLLFSLSFITLGLYLIPGLFKIDKNESQRPNGLVFAWVDSFLLPEAEAGGGWKHNLDEALAEAKQQNKLVFLDFTGTLCTNCKLNEKQIFPKPAVKEAFAKLVLLKLYTDTAPPGDSQVPAPADALKLRDEEFKSSALPLYALLRPSGNRFEIVAVYNKGLIGENDIPQFVRFLEKR